MNPLNILQEELKDIPIKEKLYHRTNLKNLIKIIKSGHIKGSETYGKERDKRGQSEIASARKSTFSSIDSLRKKDPKGFKLRMLGLSDRVGAVEIVLFKDRVVGSHLTRGIKKRPISEFPVLALKTLDFELENYYKNKTTEKKVKKELLKLKPPFNDVKKVLNKYPFKKVLKYDLIVIDEIVRALKDIYKYSKEREGEERFYKKSEIKIPLDDRLMKIRFLPISKKEVIFLTREEIDELQKLIKKNKDLFIKNEALEKMMEE